MFKLSDTYEEGYQNLKKMLSLASILTLSKKGMDFIVFCDTFRVVHGGVLIKEIKVVLFFSIVEASSEEFPTHDLELATVVFVFKLWLHYLYGIYF